MNGKDLFIMIMENNTSTIIAGTKTNDIDVSTDTIETTSPTTGKWKEYVPRRSKWGVTTTFLLTNGQHAKDLLKSGTLFTLILAYKQGSTTVQLLTGQAYLVTCKISATIGNLAQGSFQFVGNGELAEPSTSNGQSDSSGGEDDSEEEEQ